MERVNIAVASPSDLGAERDAVLKIFNRWNSANEHAILHPVMWESASVPALGDHPQHILNPQIIEKSHLMIAMLWTKLGTPTPTAQSGTVEEIREFGASTGLRRIMLYFCTRDLPYDVDPVALGKLRSFKDEMRALGLCHEFRTLDEFEGDLYRHLDMKIHELLTGQLPIPRVELQREGPARTQPQGDPRLQELDDFGNSLGEIAANFSLRMDEFDTFSGAGPNKFLALAAHVYSSVAWSLDRFVAASGISPENRVVVQFISDSLKRLAGKKTDYLVKPFPQYFVDGREVSKGLLAHVEHLRHVRRG